MVFGKKNVMKYSLLEFEDEKPTKKTSKLKLKRGATPKLLTTNFIDSPKDLTVNKSRSEPVEIELNLELQVLPNVQKKSMSEPAIKPTTSSLSVPRVDDPRPDCKKRLRFDDDTCVKELSDKSCDKVEENSKVKKSKKSEKGVSFKRLKKCSKDVYMRMAQSMLPESKVDSTDLKGVVHRDGRGKIKLLKDKNGDYLKSNWDPVGDVFEAKMNNIDVQVVCIDQKVSLTHVFKEAVGLFTLSEKKSCFPFYGLYPLKRHSKYWNLAFVVGKPKSKTDVRNVLSETKRLSLVSLALGHYEKDYYSV